MTLSLWTHILSASERVPFCRHGTVVSFQLRLIRRAPTTIFPTQLLGTSNHRGDRGRVTKHKEQAVAQTQCGVGVGSCIAGRAPVAFCCGAAFHCNLPPNHPHAPFDRFQRQVDDVCLPAEHYGACDRRYDDVVDSTSDAMCRWGVSPEPMLEGAEGLQLAVGNAV
jgi:hypothetical protein